VRRIKITDAGRMAIEGPVRHTLYWLADSPSVAAARGVSVSVINSCRAIPLAWLEAGFSVPTKAARSLCLQTARTARRWHFSSATVSRARRSSHWSALAS